MKSERWVTKKRKRSKRFLHKNIGRHRRYSISVSSLYRRIREQSFDSNIRIKRANKRCVARTFWRCVKKLRTEKTLFRPRPRKFYGDKNQLYFFKNDEHRFANSSFGMRRFCIKRLYADSSDAQSLFHQRKRHDFDRPSRRARGGATVYVADLAWCFAL